MTDQTSPNATILEQERLLAALAYGLYLISFAGGISLLAGVIIALVRKPYARGTLYESHYRNLIQVFFVVLAWAGLAVAVVLAGVLNLVSVSFRPELALWQWPVTAMLFPAVALLTVLVGVWFFWRVLRGFIRALDEKPY